MRLAQTEADAVEPLPKAFACSICKHRNSSSDKHVKQQPHTQTHAISAARQRVAEPPIIFSIDW
jgi:hypothetical protein